MIFIFILPFFAQSKEIAITLDDAPMRDLNTYSGIQRTKRLIKIFKQNDVKVVFFSNSSKLKNSMGERRLQMYNDAGHFIANHTHSHPNLKNLGSKKYIFEIKQANDRLSKFSNYKKWFRYPFLSHGNKAKDRDPVRDYLTKNSYINGYVTVDTQDWFIADQIDKYKARGGKINKKKLCRIYSSMVLDSAVYFDKMAVTHLGRSPKHNVLLHENDLSAMCLGRLIKTLKKNDWKIINPDNAFSDPIYKTKPKTFYNNNGQVAALIHEKNGKKISDPWATPWEGGKKIVEHLKANNLIDH